MQLTDSRKKINMYLLVILLREIFIKRARKSGSKIPIHLKRNRRVIRVLNFSSIDPIPRMYDKDGDGGDKPIMQFSKEGERKTVSNPEKKIYADYDHDRPKLAEFFLYTKPAVAACSVEASLLRYVQIIIGGSNRKQIEKPPRFGRTVKL